MTTLPRQTNPAVASAAPAVTTEHTGLPAYFRNLRQSCRYAGHSGLTPHAGFAAELRQVFVPPHLSRTYADPRLGIPGGPEPHSRLEAAQLIRAHRRLFILGDQGAGKTTLLQWLALALSDDEDNPVKAILGDRVPFLLTVQDLPLSQVNGWSSLWRAFLKRNRHLVAPLRADKDLLARLFQSGQALLLIDGLDAATDPASCERLRRAIRQGMSRHRFCSFVLTSGRICFDPQKWSGLDAENLSRPEAKQPVTAHMHPPARRSLLHSQNTARRTNFKNGMAGIDLPASQSPPAVFYLAPFDAAGRNEFIANWCRQYADQQTATPDRFQALQGLIARDAGLAALAGMPLLLELVCFLHSQNQRLPDNRSELYRGCAEITLAGLMRARDARFGGREAGYDRQDVCNWLATLALRLQDGRRDSGQPLVTTRQEIMRHLCAELARHGIDAARREAEAGFILAHVSDGAGLLRAQGDTAGQPPCYGFAHPGVLAYFAAVALRQQARHDAECLAGRRLTTGQSGWHECWNLFFEQLADADLTEKYLHQLFGPGLDGEGCDAMQQALLQAKIVINGQVRLTDAVRRARIRQIWEFHLKTVFFHPLLLQCAALFELMWTSRFDSRDIFIRQARETAAGSLYLSGPGVADLSVLAAQTQLRTLALTSTAVTDLAPLSGLANLMTLFIRNTGIADWTLLAALPGLEILALIDTGIADLSPLQALSNLSTLVLHGPGIVDAAPLAGLTGLRHLSLAATGITDIGPLAALRQLRGLDLSHTGCADISILCGYTQLHSLDLSYTAAADLTPLAGLQLLQTLDLTGTCVTDLSPLTGIRHLQTLCLPGRGLKGEELLTANNVELIFPD